MAKVKREELLACLHQLAPATTKRETIEQSSCFVFTNGRAITFDSTVCCSMASPFGNDVEGGISAKELVSCMSLLDWEELRVTQSDDHIIIRPGVTREGVKECTKIYVQPKIVLPFDLVEPPAEEDWMVLHPNFGEALGAVCKSCKPSKTSRDTCKVVHITPDTIEATNGAEACRWPMKTGFSEDFLVETERVAQMAPMGMTEVCLGKKWVHFRNAATKLNCSILLVELESGYILPEHMDAVFDFPTHPIRLPKSLINTIKVAEVFTYTNETTNKVLVEFKKGRCRVTGTGPLGQHYCEREVDYDGEDFAFYIDPDRLRTIVEEHPDILLGKKRIKIETNDYSYITALIPVDEVEEGQE